MYKKFRERLSIHLVKNPGRVVIAAILLFNVVFLFISAFIISSFSIHGTEDMGFWEAAFYTVIMILDAGCIQFVVEDVGAVGIAVIIVCLAVIIVGMITFTGAVIGYLTNYISDFIANANSGSRRLYVSGHVIILNWNSRAAEIINDMLYCEERKNIVVLSNRKQSEIEKEISDYISDTVTNENKLLAEQCAGMPFFKKIRYLHKHLMHNNLTVIVREGDTYSSKQLRDISLEHAETVIILGRDEGIGSHKPDDTERRGNAHTVKTLVQVAEITGAEDSDNDQKIVVEVDDEWTMDLVDKIIDTKQVDGKCNIVPIRVNKILGQILSQFTLMPELNLVYKELFSNKGTAFFSRELRADDISYNLEFMKHNKHAIPLTCMSGDGKSHYYYTAAAEADIYKKEYVPDEPLPVRLNKDYRIDPKRVIILGHNSKCRYIMEGFNSFRNEWNYDDSREILQIMIIDSKKNLEKMDYYREYPYVIKTVEADIYDREIIVDAINSFVDDDYSTSVLILSDDTVANEDIDAEALTNLIYVQDIVRTYEKTKGASKEKNIDVIVEILNPKNHDTVKSYNINNVVISNRYISKMITQIGEKDSMFDFYNDILVYDDDTSAGYDSKEVYIKPASVFFEQVPEATTADKLIRSVYKASVENSSGDGKSMSILLGYVKNGELTLFSGNQSHINIELDNDDKMVVFSNH